jgi:hypothetical protein
MDDILFDFPDFGLSDDESESELSLASNSDGEEEEEDDEWYNIPSDSDSDSDDEAPSTPFVLLRSGATSASTSGTSTLIRKEHSIGTRIRALTMMNDKISIARITKVTGISRTRIYNLVANTRERG